MTTIRIVLEYNGTKFSGWQSQPSARNIEDELKKTLSIVCRYPISSVIASGRTDSGVHAYGQVAIFRLPDNHPFDLWQIQNGVSSLLKGEVAIVAIDVVPSDFHPRKKIEFKEYHYKIQTRRAPLVFSLGRAWHFPIALDTAKIQKGLVELIGEKDFTSFAAKDCQSASKIKKIYSAELRLNGSELIFVFCGSGFLKQMVRIMVGTLVDIGRGKITNSITEIINFKDRAYAGLTAPPHGLYLYTVAYE
jgi:tRNA pseudouridine38-40 synthase